MAAANVCIPEAVNVPVMAVLSDMATVPEPLPRIVTFPSVVDASTMSAFSVLVLGTSI